MSDSGTILFEYVVDSTYVSLVSKQDVNVVHIFVDFYISSHWMEN